MPNRGHPLTPAEQWERQRLILGLLGASMPVGTSSAVIGARLGVSTSRACQILSTMRSSGLIDRNKCGGLGTRWGLPGIRAEADERAARDSRPCPRTTAHCSVWAMADARAKETA